MRNFYGNFLEIKNIDLQVLDWFSFFYRSQKFFHTGGWNFVFFALACLKPEHINFTFTKIKQRNLLFMCIGMITGGLASPSITHFSQLESVGFPQRIGFSLLFLKTFSGTT